jgi:DNA-binding transcriptional LysR family regulator
VAPPPLQLIDVEAFVRVVQAGGYAAAAKSLGVSRSHASRLVSGLEARLGVRLLHRTTRRVATTQTGRTFYEAAAPIIDALLAAEARASAEREEVFGILRVSIPLQLGHDYLQEPLARFLDEHPGVEMLVDFTDRKADLVADGFDVAIRGGSADDPNLVARRLWPFNIGVYASPEYVARHGAPSSPAELGHHPCLMFAHLAQPRQWRLQRGEEEALAVVSGPLLATSTSALADAAANGRGVVYLPDFAVKARVDSGALVRVMPDWSGPRQWFWAVRAHRTSLPARMRLFVDYLAQLWDPPPWLLA